MRILNGLLASALALAGTACRPADAAEEAPVPLVDKGSACKLHGKVKLVTSFPRYKVKLVTSFPDAKVKKVTSFPDKPGEWQIVDSFPDFTIQIVDSFPDFSVQYVDSFPGCS